jgi:DHA1 family tetracycline resistance protein-like MFS transporter
MPLLLLGRIIDGLAAGNISTAQSSISDISKDAKERAGNLGIIGMIFGLGFIVGPFLGGMLSRVSHSFPFFFVGGMALLNVILAYFFLPETNKHIDRSKVISWNPMKPILAAFRNIKLRTLYIVWFMFTGIGFILALNQGFLLKKFWLQKFKEKQLIMLMIGFFAIGFSLMSIQSIWFFVLGMIFTAFGQSTLGVAMTSEIVGEADIKERGEAVGVLSSIASVANILAPIGSGLAFQYKDNLPYMLAAALSVICLLIMYVTKVSERHNAESDILAKEVTL